MFRKLMTLDEAQQIIQNHLRPKSTSIEEIPLLEAHNRVLAKDVIATLDIPPFNRSTVDGYAVKAKDTFGAEESRPAKLKVCGAVNIGKLPRAKVASGKAAEIVTGAPMPEGADAVVMVEDTNRKGDFIYVFAAVTRAENVMKAGSDIRKSETVLKAGQLLGSREIGVLAAVGIARVRVHAVPRVAVLSTGAEVTEPGGRLPPGRIYDINAYSLGAAVLESGGKPILMGVFPDDRIRLKKALVEALDVADVIVTSGGVSVGPKDIMPQTVDSLGKPGVIVSGIAIKPGKPATVAIVDGKPIFSLPGHPTSALLVFHLLIRPIIAEMAGRRAERSLEVKAFAGMRMFPARGRRTFVMVRLRRDKSDRLVADAVESGQSGAITTLAKADGFVEVAENQQFIDADDEIVVRLFRSQEKAVS
jgi:molybdenum cofactor synthesis domain-containing protein